jgi:hypothetical protein
MTVVTQKSGVGGVIAKIVIVSLHIAFGSKEMEVKTCNRVSSMQLRGLYEVMVGKAHGKKTYDSEEQKAAGGSMKYGWSE